MRKFLPTLANLQIGDRIVVPKSTLNLVQHHAIFLGVKKGRYQFIENKDGIGVRLVTAEIFFLGVNKITDVMRFKPKVGYNRNDLERYALTKLGKPYHLINYNCEHFSSEVQNRIVKSQQADTGIGIAIFGLAALIIGGIAGGTNK